MIFVDYPGHWIALGMVLVLIAGLWLAFRGHCLKRLGIRRWLLTLLPLGSMLILLAVFFNPSSIQMSKQSRPCTVQVFFDTSQSMSIEDMNNKSRLEYATDLFKEKFIFSDEKGPLYQIFGFDQHYYSADSLDSLVSKGEQSNLNSVWKYVFGQSAQTEKKLNGVSVTGAIIFTDGQVDNQNLSYYMTIQNKNFPVLLIPVGLELKQPDLLVCSLDVPAQTAVNTTYTAEVVIEARQLKNQSIQVDLLQNNHVISSRFFTPKEIQETKTLDFEVSTSSTGLDKIEVLTKTTIDELNTDNNSRIKMVNVVSSDQRRVLLYSQVAAFDIGKIRQALKRDEKIELDFRLDAVIDPAIIKNDPNLNEQVKLPMEANELNDFDVLILGAMDFNALSESQVQSLYSFVVNRGGAIVFLAGKDEYSLSKIRHPKLCSLIPVTFSNQTENMHYAIDVIPVKLTLEGMATGLFSESNVGTGGCFLTEGYTNIEKKPAASTLFTFNQEPFVSIQRVGRGYVSFLNSFTLFQLYQADQEGGALQELLSGLISYISQIRAEESRIDLGVNINGDQNKVVFEAYIRDSQYEPVNGATVLLDVNGQLTRMTPSSKGRYTATLENLNARSVFAVAKAELGGNFLGKKTVVLDLPQKHEEMSQTEANKKFLETLAMHTHTSYLNPYQISKDTKKSFKGQETLQQKAQSMPIWHNWIMISVLCMILTINWFIRRTMGLV